MNIAGVCRDFTKVDSLVDLSGTYPGGTISHRSKITIQVWTKSGPSHLR